MGVVGQQNIGSFIVPAMGGLQALVVKCRALTLFHSDKLPSHQLHTNQKNILALYKQMQIAVEIVDCGLLFVTSGYFVRVPY